MAMHIRRFFSHIGLNPGPYMFDMSRSGLFTIYHLQRTSSHGEPRLLSMCFILQSLHLSAPRAPYFA